jgi:hypothetical protein
MHNLKSLEFFFRVLYFVYCTSKYASVVFILFFRYTKPLWVEIVGLETLFVRLTLFAGP